MVTNQRIKLPGWGPHRGLRHSMYKYYCTGWFIGILINLIMAYHGLPNNPYITWVVYSLVTATHSANGCNKKFELY